MSQTCVNTKQLLLNIKNNTDKEFPIDVLQNAYQNSFLNSTTQYKWDITTESYANRNMVGIQVKTSSTGDYTTYTAPLTDPSADGVLAALNTLGVGTFYKNEQSGQIYIVTDNDKFIYGDLYIFSKVSFAGQKDFAVNNSQTVNIAGISTNYDGPPINFTFKNLPSFVTIQQQGSFGSNPASPVTYYFILNVSPIGVGSNGNYSFDITADDGLTSVTQTFTLQVSNTVFPRFVRPYTDSNTKSITVGDDSQTWTYNETGINANSFSGGTYAYNAYNDWANSVLGPSFRVFPFPVAEEIGNGLIVYCIGRTNLSPSAFSDCLLLFVTVTP